MKKILYPALTVLTDAALVALAVLSVPCAVLTAYRVPFPLAPLAIAAAAIGLSLSIWMHVSKRGYLAGILFFAVLTPLLLWKHAAIRYGFALFRYAMLDLLAADVPFLPNATPIDPAVSAGLDPVNAVGWFVLLVMALFGLSVAWSLIRSRMLLLPVIVPLPLFMLSVIYTDLPLAHWAVLLLMLYLGTCLATGGLRVNEAEQYGAVAAPMLLVLLLLGTLIRVVSPPETYEPISFEKRQEMIGDRVQQLYDDVTNLMNNRVKRTEDLSDEEEWRRTDDTVLTLTTDAEGVRYLRAYSLGGYADSRWTSVPLYRGEWASAAALGMRATGEQHSMEITAEASEMLYVPYGFTNTDVPELREAFLPARGEETYSWTFTDAIPDAGSVTEDELEYLAWADEVYTIADSEEREALLAFAAEVGLQDLGDPYRTALAVAAFVRANAEYSTTPGKVPAGEDFVLYFLREGRKGYCVHFASATTALLQAMGYRARYVFGYRFYTTANEETAVTDEMAHAWTEIYCPGVGWVPIESTAGAEGWKEPTQETAAATAEPTTAPTPEPTPEPTQAPTDAPTMGTEQQETPEPSAVPTTEPTKHPEQDQNDEGGETTGKPLDLRWLLWLLLPVGLVGGFWGAGVLVRKKRRQRFTQKNARAAVLAMYRYQKRLERFGAPADEAAETLAEEAAFSNHSMQKGRAEMQAILNRSLAALERLPRRKRFLQKYILFLT
ncbi:MAG: transglutaminase domain-containing protein [Clostridia bacterium]|nr:transglutaminase domain-containing protein [Clostridia bacterium]